MTGRGNDTPTAPEESSGKWMHMDRSARSTEVFTQTDGVIHDMRIYFAAPLFNDAERQYNREVVELLEAEGHSVFLPQRDGIESLASLIETDPEVSNERDAMRRIFELDYSEIREADVVTALLDGQIPDEGVAVEIGLAYAHDIPVVGLKTDIRVHAQDEPLKAMVFAVLTELTETPEELVDAVDRQGG